MTDVRNLLAGMAVVLAAAGPASAVTPAELAALARAGLSDDVLIALVEATGVDRRVDAAGAVELKNAGVGERVIAAAIRASHPRSSAGEAAEPLATDGACDECGNIAVIGGASQPEVVVEREIYYVPWLVAVPVHLSPARPPRPYLEGDRGFGRFINNGSPARGGTADRGRHASRPPRDK